MIEEEPNRRPIPPEDSEQFELFGGHRRNEKIPVAWFSGSGVEENGLVRVDFSMEFYKMFSDEILPYVHGYDHGEQLKIFEGQDEESRRKVDEAEKEIKEKTGFTMKELVEERLYMQQTYSGRKNPPFEYTPNPAPYKKLE